MSRAAFDSIAIVVDWLDACKAGQVDDMLAFYHDDATIECRCEGASLTGRAALEAYWCSKLARRLPSSFAIDDLRMDADAVHLDYQSYEGKQIRIRFRFDQDGKIIHTSCGPLNHSAPSLCVRRA